VREDIGLQPSPFPPRGGSCCLEITSPTPARVWVSSFSALEASELLAPPILIVGGGAASSPSLPLYHSLSSLCRSGDCARLDLDSHPSSVSIVSIAGARSALGARAPFLFGRPRPRFCGSLVLGTPPPSGLGALFGLCGRATPAWAGRAVVMWARPPILGWARRGRVARPPQIWGGRAVRCVHASTQFGVAAPSFFLFSAAA